jgi:pimeloyl-ACP methyl ester carboxylesterase
VSDDEFQYLPEEAAEVGAVGPPPVVTRVAVDTEGGRVGVLRWGSRPATTFLHGAGLNAQTWDNTLLALDRDALAVDLPGHGDSDWRDDFDYRPATIAAAVAEVLDAVAGGVPPVLLVEAAHGFLSDDVVRELRERVPRASVGELDTGHNVQEQDPVGLASAIRGFMG